MVGGGGGGAAKLHKIPKALLLLHPLHAQGLCQLKDHASHTPRPQHGKALKTLFQQSSIATHNHDYAKAINIYNAWVPCVVDVHPY